jgi:SAM-dependent methyltransferase
MRTGEQYHQSMTASPRDRRTRDRFLQLALGLLRPGDRILDFGAGTGIDATAYAAAGHATWVYEPDDAQCTWLAEYCLEEIGRHAVIPTAFPPKEKVDAITANFAVLNLVPDHTALFDSFSRILDGEGFVLVSLLNPYYLGDIRYGWWRANLLKLLRERRYAVESASGVTRHTPYSVARSAAPHFRLEKILPSGPAFCARQYSFLLFRRA